MTECFVCKNKIDKWYSEWIYFKDTGRKLCQNCFDKHCSIQPHLCCQDFQDMNGDYVHYNLPIL